MTFRTVQMDVVSLKFREKADKITIKNRRLRASTEGDKGNSNPFLLSKGWKRDTLHFGSCVER